MIAGIPNKKRGVERLAGITALLITFLVVAAILTALDIKPDYINIHEDLSYLGDNIDRLWLNSIIWFMTSVLIVLFGPLILMSFLPYGRSSAYLAAFLISTTGILYLIIAINGLNMIRMVTVYQASTGLETDYIANISFFILVFQVQPATGCIYTGGDQFHYSRTPNCQFRITAKIYRMGGHFWWAYICQFRMDWH